MKKPIDPNGIKEIFSKIDELELEETPKVMIDVRVFHQILSPLKIYLQSQLPDGTKVTSAETIDKLAEYVEEATPYMKTREKREKSKRTVDLLRSLKPRIKKAEGKPEK